MSMITRHVPLLYGIFTALTLISLTTLVYRWLGLDRGTALYLACLTFGVVLYVVSRRMVRQSGEK
jgi:hypothetical protein